MDARLASRTTLPRPIARTTKLARVALQEQGGLGERTVSVEALDGVLRFVLRRVAGGLYVEREFR